MPTHQQTNIYYEVHGKGKPLFLGFPLMASYGEIFGKAAGTAVRDAFLERLCDAYEVLLVDYPSIGKSGEIVPEDLTADRVCSDLLAVASGAGFDRFAWWGYSWGNAVGLQLAARSSRIAALAGGGWPPLGAAYETVLRATRQNVTNPPEHARVVLRRPEQYRQWITFYESLAGWNELEALRRMRCPRLIYYGSRADSSSGSVAIPIATVIREHRTELESLGWDVVEIPDAEHEIGLRADVVVPIVRHFLEGAAW